MTLNSAMRLSSSGMTVERFRMDKIAENLANANTIQMGNRPPHRRQEVVLATDETGVRVADVLGDERPFRQEYDPANPYNVNGYVIKSNVQPLEEMVDMISASRAYEANVAAFNTAKSMARSALSIGKV